MNSSQRTLLAVAALGLGLMLLFPPYDSVTLARGASTFDAYYFVFDRQHNKTINLDLLSLQLGWLMLNAIMGWFLLRNYSPETAVVKRRTAVLLFGAANLVLLLLFPPFENYSSSARFSGTHFDSFYFLFGDKGNRHIYVPLLYLEVLYVLVNTATLWLLFREPAQPEESD